MAASWVPPLISSDGHLEVRPERWTPHMPAHLREKAPRTIKLPDGGDALLVEGQPPYPAPFLDLRAGRTNETWMPIGATVDDTAGVGPPEQRLEEQDMDGLHAEVLFANMQVGPRLWRTLADEDVYRATVRAYNDWLAKEYCAVSRDRLIGLGVIPWSNLDDAIAELHHCAKIGLKGVTLGVFPNGKPYPKPEDDRFWAAAIDLGMPLTVHVGFDRLGARAKEPTFEYPEADPEMMKKVGPRKMVEWVALPFLSTAPSISLSQLILSGVFDRLPKLRIFFAETRLGWVPFWMEEADYWFERHRHWAQRLLGFKSPKRRPSEYVQEHISFSCQPVERVAMELRHHMGVEHIMFATDFPHIECEWPNTRPQAERLFADVPADVAYKIAAGNVLSYFGLNDTAMARKVLSASAEGLAATRPPATRTARVRRDQPGLRYAGAMSDGENILSRVPKQLLARALKKLPAADIWHADTAETTIDVPGLGAVRVTARRTQATSGKPSQYFWTPEKATAVGDS